jgi:hypothetical protein
MFEVTPTDALTPVRAAILSAIADMQGAEQVPEPVEWTPHFSLAYINSGRLAAPFITRSTACRIRLLP